MKILLLNLYFPPDTSATAKMAQTVVDALCKEHDVTVVCGRPSYDPTERRGWRLWQTEKSGRLKIIRVGSSAFPRFSMKKRVINYLSYVLIAVPRALFVVGCDAVLAMTDPPFEGIVGAFVAMLKGKPYLYNIRDMYPDMAVGGSIVEPGLLARTWEMLHRWALRRADCVIVLGEDMKNRILAKGIEGPKLEIVRDGTEISAGGSAPTLDIDVVQKIRGGFQFVLLHAGNLGFYGAWETLLSAAKKLTVDNVGFVFVGEGAQRDALAAAAVNIPNVKFLPFFPGSKIPSVLAAADAHLITVKRGLEGVVVPSKMYGILAAGKPTVAVAPMETDVASLGMRQGFGIATDPDKPEELVDAIRALVADSNRVKQMGTAAKEASRSYDRVFELQKFVRIVGRVAAGEKN